MKKTLILFGVLLFCVTCKKHEYLTLQQEAYLEYKEGIGSFPAFLTDFFPDTIREIYSCIEAIDTTSKCIYYMTFDFFINQDTHLENILKEKHWIHLNAADTNFMVITRNTNFEWGICEKVFYENVKDNETCYIIPFFEEENLSRIGITEDIYSSNTVSGLTEEFDIYILETKSGNVSDLVLQK